MANFADLWNGIKTTLETNKAALGIESVEKAEKGKQTTIKVPGAIVMLDPGETVREIGGTAVTVRTNVIIYIIARPKASAAAAIDEALTIATACLKLLAGTFVADCDITAAESPIEIIDFSSTSGIVAVTLIAGVDI